MYYCNLSGCGNALLRWRRASSTPADRVSGLNRCVRASPGRTEGWCGGQAFDGSDGDPITFGALGQTPQPPSSTGRTDRVSGHDLLENG